MPITRLPREEFYEKYLPLCKPIQGLPKEEEEAIRDEIYRMDSELRKALADYTEGDFETSWDWNPCWHHSGGIYGRNAFCADFLQRVKTVLAVEKHEWCVHFACEPDFEGLENGQFFIHRGEVYADASENLDYSVFETT